MDDRLLLIMSRAHFRITEHIKKEFRKNGVHTTANQTAIMFLLRNNKKMPMGEIGEALEIDNSAVTSHIDKMEASGLVRRETNPGDRRQLLISLTDQGWETSQKALEISRKINEIVKEGFTSPEIEIFKRVLMGCIDKF